MNRMQAAPRRSLPCGLLLAVLILGTWAPTLAQPAETTRTLNPQMSVSPGWALSVGESLTLDASRSTHDVPTEETDEVRFTWTLGDETTLVGERVTHRYAAPGTYDVELRMEVFETGGVFRRANASRQVTVRDSETPTLVSVIDLETGFALPGGSYAAIIQIRNQYFLLDPSGAATATASNETGGPTQVIPINVERPAPAGWMLGAGALSIDSMMVLYATLGWDLEVEPWSVNVSIGSSTGGTSVSLAQDYAQVELAGYSLNAEIDRVSLAMLGAGYQVTDRLCFLGSLGLLNVVGRLEGGSRLHVDGQPLPIRFSEYLPTLGFGAGIRLGWMLLSMQLLLLL